MNSIRYKDYVGSVEFIDSKLVIKILYIDDIITTECDSAAKVREAFQDLVEDYIETCRALNKEPSKPFKGSFNVRVTPALHRAIAMCANESGESMNAWIERCLADRVERQKAIRKFSSTEVMERYFSGIREVGWFKSIVTVERTQSLSQQFSPVLFTKAYNQAN